MSRRRLLAVAAALGGTLATGCSGSSCEDLPALTDRRDEARDRYEAVSTERAAGRATEQQLDEAHDVMHGLDTRVYDLGASCG